MNIEFTEDATIEKRYDTCCFSGNYKTELVTFSKGQEIEVLNESMKQGRLPNGRKLDKITLLIDNHTLHPDKLIDVPLDVIKEYLK